MAVTDSMRCALAIVGTIAVATGHVCAADGAPSEYVRIEGETIEFRYGATDPDMAILDAHPDVKTIMIGANEEWSGPDPSLYPFEITDVGFARIAKCKKLENLRASSIHPLQVTDDGLEAIAELKQLRAVDLGGAHRFSDAGMAHLSRLVNLEELWLDFNREVGDGTMRAVSGLTKLRVLRFHGAPVTDDGIREIRRLMELEDLQLGHARVGDPALEIIGGFTKLKTLDLQHTNVTDAGMAHLSSLKLEWLCLKGTNTSGAGLASVADMPDIEWLFLSGTRIDDASLEHLSRMTALKSLDLSGTSVTNAGVTRLTRHERLEHLKLNDVQLTDEIVPSLLQMKSLTDLEANGTKLSRAAFDALAEAGVERINVFEKR